MNQYQKDIMDAMKNSKGLVVVTSEGIGNPHIPPEVLYDRILQARRSWESFNEDSKSTLHSSIRDFLRSIARSKCFGEEAIDFDLRSNRAGPGVMGEVTLHTPNLYIQFGETFILMRTCSSRKDYTGGGNNIVPYNGNLFQFDTTLTRLINEKK